jgi:hypothetical protein
MILQIIELNGTDMEKLGDFLWSNLVFKWATLAKQIHESILKTNFSTDRNAMIHWYASNVSKTMKQNTTIFFINLSQELCHAVNYAYNLVVNYET